MNRTHNYQKDVFIFFFLPISVFLTFHRYLFGFMKFVFRVYVIFISICVCFRGVLLFFFVSSFLFWKGWNEKTGFFTLQFYYFKLFVFTSIRTSKPKKIKITKQNKIGDISLTSRFSFENFIPERKKTQLKLCK